MLTLTFGIGTWVIECALLCYTLVPSMKYVGEIAFEIWPFFFILANFWTFDLDLWSKSSAFESLNAPY